MPKYTEAQLAAIKRTIERDKEYLKDFESKTPAQRYEELYGNSSKTKPQGKE
jgi:hypothetical protein